MPVLHIWSDLLISVSPKKGLWYILSFNDGITVHCLKSCNCSFTGDAEQIQLQKYMLQSNKKCKGESTAIRVVQCCN